MVLPNVNFEVSEGELVIISGPSGSGKTTLLRLISLLEATNAGTIKLDDVEFRYEPLEKSKDWKKSEPYRSKVCLVFQQLFMWPHMTIRNSIKKTRKRGFEYKELAKTLNVSHILDRYPNQVSLGQRQRAALIRALSTQAQYFLFDEITSALDDDATRVVVDILREMINNNKAVVLVTHSPEKLAELYTTNYVINSVGEFNRVEPSK